MKTGLLSMTELQFSQTLLSGITIRQNFFNSIRPVLFETDYTEYPYATSGGTLFIVVYKKIPYAITCGHVGQHFDWRDLVVTETKRGPRYQNPAFVYYPSHPCENAVDAQILDIVVFQFTECVDLSYFSGAYVLDEKTWANSSSGDTLKVAGFPKSHININYENKKIIRADCLLELRDNTPPSKDVTIRRATGNFNNIEPLDMIGFSGSPVFNVTRNALCGVAARGGRNGKVFDIWYIDFFDISKFLDAVHSGLQETYYPKTILKKKN